MKKILSLLLILLLSVALISGCFKKTDKPTTVNDTTTTDIAESTDGLEVDEEIDENEADTDWTDSTSEETDTTTAASYEESGTSTGAKTTTGSKAAGTDSATAATYEAAGTATGAKTTTGTKTTTGSKASGTDAGTGASYEEETPVAPKPVTTTPKPVTPTPTTPTPTTPTPTTPIVDTTTAASLDVQDATVLAKSIGKDGKWIVATTKNITTTNALVMEGDLLKTGSTTLQRKLALYTQDANKNVTAEFTLTAPKLTIKSPNARIQNGTFIGDIYVETTDFQLVGTKVIGNVYFTNDAAKAGFKMDAKSSITPKSAATQSVDGATAASLEVQSASVLQKSIGTEGKWIVATTKDITTDKALVMEGDLLKTGSTTLQRKLALYSQVKDPVTNKNVVTAEFKLTALKLTIKSPNARIQNGTYIGDIYVETTDFQLVGTKVTGNVFFLNDAAKAGFKMDEASSVSGSKEYLYK